MIPIQVQDDAWKMLGGLHVNVFVAAIVFKIIFLLINAFVGNQVV